MVLLDEIDLRERANLDAIGGGVRGAKASSAEPALRAGALIALVGLAGIAAICVAAAQDRAPLVSPDRIEDVASIRPDPYPDFDAFAWRAFIAINWPSLTDPAHRGEPDRLKTLGDSGPRVWETFKARYELFQVGPDGRPIPPKPWATYQAVNPCGAEVDNRAKTLATFTPFMDFNQSAFLPGVAANPLVAQMAPIRVTKSASTRPNMRRLRGAAGARAKTCPIPPIRRACRRARSRSRPRGGLSPRWTRPRFERAITWSRTPTSSTSLRRSPRAIRSVRKATSRWSACTS